MSLADGSTDAGVAARPWRAPSLDPPPPAPAPPSVAELEGIAAAARAEGYARGHEEGLAQSLGEQRRLAAQLAGVIDAFARPLGELGHDVQNVLGAAAAQIAGALLRREYVAEPALLAALVAEALAAVGDRDRKVEVRLHPDDLAAVLPLVAADPLARLAADATLARGDVRVHADNLRLDARLATRLDAVVAGLARSAP
ncbi:FliH/SctL family protein [Tahibacter soli]|jgi:flagellar assembly protein FliH|uniref:Flagellar assembly protein FliH n=1 Tax=Tahibacter soli TaxID=2983605 RepID=A0A9X3YKH7_9GAMM|nr:FliH/SctL family protein [Tahibacter soli]MDC8012865.1 FliH/SctL family protein [Tahibacter soli]